MTAARNQLGHRFKALSNCPSAQNGLGQQKQVESLVFIGIYAKCPAVQRPRELDSWTAGKGGRNDAA
jgi:hypothetical protein